MRRGGGGIKSDHYEMKNEGGGWRVGELFEKFKLYLSTRKKSHLDLVPTKSHENSNKTTEEYGS